MRIRIVHFHRIVAGHLGGADLGLSLITPTAEREEVLDFSTPYLDSPPTVRRPQPAPKCPTSPRPRNCAGG